MNKASPIWTSGVKLVLSTGVNLNLSKIKEKTKDQSISLNCELIIRKKEYTEMDMHRGHQHKKRTRQKNITFLISFKSSCPVSSSL